MRIWFSHFPGLSLELDLDSDDDTISSAWWSWRGLTFAEAVVGHG